MSNVEYLPSSIVLLSLQKVYAEDDNSDKVPDSNSELETIFENSRSEHASSGNGSGSAKHNHENPLFFDLLPQARPEMAAGWIPEVGHKISSLCPEHKILFRTRSCTMRDFLLAGACRQWTVAGCSSWTRWPGSTRWQTQGRGRSATLLKERGGHSSVLLPAHWVSWMFWLLDRLQRGKQWLNMLLR